MSNNDEPHYVTRCVDTVSMGFERWAVDFALITVLFGAFLLSGPAPATDNALISDPENYASARAPDAPSECAAADHIYEPTT
ncbi:hypothetical protein C8J35_1173 [Rhizobium sp. PP-F2F-G38]|uniref:hypothetical protein n=1 Tax=Rhizobium sp. PP-CC-3G-465 TaxID=2135648 RepID=UPI000D8AD643|nr:hypothetical protein C8J37_12814 [Rhizobium sp. PP-WC-1G-195]PYE39874.1 hypothetical protein DFI02_1225 [Rhizobium sp. PP-F2F-G20b]PYE92971.1 hypothetical protein C8J35_1173 [Rhizobium sp. PP-F2F-G38]TCP79043.1 hypothetical protein C8J31_1194 [Rhizobium sp. PP-CC-2G-626]TCQ02824.1 hypothetical protein C8J34_11545 [Rhizobium sp. PP-F2F-G36]TCQ15911.1 hypothetical protein C8J33_1184 [Rhizobium sp. PP-CC-3G-465]